MNKPDPWTCASVEWFAYFANADFDSTWREQLQWAQARAITERRHSILAGTGRDVLDAVAECARCGLTMPPWLAGEFLRRHGAVTSFRAASWDDPTAFGLAHPELGKPPKITTLRKHELRVRALPVLMYLFKPGGLARGDDGFKAAAALLHKSGITAKQVKTILPLTRTNKRGAKTNAASELTDRGINWTNPFAIGKVPDSGD